MFYPSTLRGGGAQCKDCASASRGSAQKLQPKKAIVAQLRQAFGSEVFSSLAAAEVLNKNSMGMGALLHNITANGLLIRRGVGQYLCPEQPYTEPTDTEPTDMITADAPALLPPLDAPTSDQVAPFTRIGDYYFNSGAILVADATHSGVIKLFTPLLEVDGPTRQAKNKVIIFQKDQDVEEYRQVMGWLKSSSQDADLYQRDCSTLEAERDAAMQLAEQAEARAADAETQLAKVKALFG